MTGATPTRAADGAPALTTRLLLGMALVLVALKLVILFTLPVYMDEAYYWLWGQHPALSYYDHPPLVGWLAGLSGTLFGWTLFAVRLPVLLTLAGDIWLLWLFAGLLAPSDRQRHFALTLILFLATPLFFIATGVAVPDHVMIVLLLASLYAFCRFARGWQAGGDHAFVWLFAGALALGLAVLAKLSAALIGLGLVVFLIASPTYRPLFGRWQLWAAGLVSLVPTLPILLWNLDHDLVGFQFILSDRHSGSTTLGMGLLLLAGNLLMVLSPFLLPVFYGALRRAWGRGLSRLLALAAITATGLIAILAIFTAVPFHWVLAGCVPLLPLMAAGVRRTWVLGLHLVWSLAMVGLVTYNIGVDPFLARISSSSDTGRWSHGWAEVVPLVAALQRETGVSAVAARRYESASPLAFALRNPDVTSLNGGTDQFDFWDSRLQAGDDAILVIDNWQRHEAGVSAKFSTLVPAHSVDVAPLGETVVTYWVGLGRAYRGD